MPFQLAEEAEEEQSAEKCAIQEELLWDHRILLVEDHDLNAKIVTRLLESKQIQVERAKTAKRRLSCMQQVLHIAMMQLNGYTDAGHGWH